MDHQATAFAVFVGLDRILDLVSLSSRLFRLGLSPLGVRCLKFISILFSITNKCMCMSLLSLMVHLF